jgi:hypothetical protein
MQFACSSKEALNSDSNRVLVIFLLNILTGVQNKVVLVTNKDLMVPARKKGYAIPALNIQNLESIKPL